MNTILVGGGNCSSSFLEQYLSNHTYDILIAVDRGLEAFSNLPLAPHHIIGDFDSVSPSILKFYQNNPLITFHAYPSEKDETDMELAIQLALKLNSKEITILGGIGSRMDHTLANLHLLMLPLEKQVSCKIVNEENQIQLLNSHNSLILKESFGTYISLLPLTTQVIGVTLVGFKYPLSNYTLTIGKSLGISNEKISDIASISLKDGILLIIESKD